MIEPIAIIGMSCRVPGAADTKAFWRNLINGVESVRFFSREEQAALGVPPSELDDPAFVPAAPVLDDMDGFDAAFFGMTSREAAVADPQHRLFLELAHTALEDAGYDPARYDGEIAVYGGSGPDDYLWRNVARNRRVWETTGRRLAFVGNSPDYLATFVSYKLNLRGPSLSVHTACSTSLVALHLACEALRGGETDLALAGGASIELPHGHGYVYVEGGTDSPDGHCRAFDKNAGGTVWGSGGGMLVLKRLSDALADRDNIRAVVRGNAINNDGSAKVAFSAPSQDGQAAVIAQAVAVSGVDASTVGFVEAHGTGTPLGDPIEIAALRSVYKDSCVLGAVKSNIGHLSQGAGVAGVIKAVLAMEHELIPPTLHFEYPGADLGPFYINKSPSTWDDPVRRAAVSSFGFGGTNAHVILEQAPAVQRTETDRPQLLQVSARDAKALDEAVSRLVGHLSEHPSVGLADVAHTLQKGRARYDERVAVVARDVLAAVGELRNAKRDRVSGSRVAFLFSGQGSQYKGMGRGLYETEPVYHAAIDECGVDLETELIDQTRYTQPALFAVEYALARLWESWGVRPQAMIGHSIGEYVAACLAGVFTLPEALRLVRRRGELMQSLPPGAMVAVRTDASKLDPPEGVSIATINGPGTCVLSGPVEAVEAYAATIAAKGVAVTKLRTSHAFHSAMMEPILAEFEAAVAQARPQAPRIPFLSNVTGEWITAEQATDPAYWARHLRETVRFGDCVRTLLDSEGDWQLVEVGPGRQLAGLARIQTGRERRAPLHSLPSAGENQSDLEVVLGTAGKLWVQGIPVEVDAGPARRVSLPAYPYQRQRHWVDPDPVTDTVVESPARLPLPEWFSVPAWRQIPLTSAQAVEECLVFGDLDIPGGVKVMPGDDYEPLLRTATRIVHAWSLLPAANAGDIWEAQRLGLFSVIELVRKLPGTPVRLDIVTRGAADPLGGDLNRPEHATLAAIAKVLPHEQPQVTVRLIDGAPKDVIAELGRSDGPEMVALRNGRRWVPAYESVSLAEGEPPLKVGGTYLVTGGLGGIGITIAKDLARLTAGRIVLLSRSALPEPSEWDDHLAAGSRFAGAIAGIREMEAHGAQVAVYAFDVADIDRLRAIGRVDGIVHAAGVPGGGIIELKDLAVAQEVMAPKLAGTLALREAFPDPDFVVLCSSVTAIGGGVGQVDYCAANAFLDAVARCGTWGSGRTRVVSVNWGAWLEVGMSVLTDPLAAPPVRAIAEPLDHPILSWVHRPVDGSMAWCSGIVSPRRHWVLDEHRVSGMALMPGFGHLEVVRSAAVACLPRPSDAFVLRLRDVAFVRPLAVADDGAAELEVRFTVEGDFTVSSGGSVHAQGIAEWVAPPAEARHDVAALLTRCGDGVREVSEQELAQSGPLSLGPHWRSLRRVYDGGKEELARLEAPSLVAGELDSLPLHPALFDESTAFGLKGRKGNTLPFGFGSVLIRRPLTARMWSHLIYRDSDSAEIFTTDLTMFDDDGNELLAAGEFMLRPTDATSVVAAAASGSGSHAADPAMVGIRPDEGAQALRRILSHDVGPQVVVAARPLKAILEGWRPAEEPLQVNENESKREEYVLVGTPAERKLAAIWGDILGATGVTADDNFFDLGGNSLVAMQLVAAIRSGFGVRLPMRILFDAPTVASMAIQIEQLQHELEEPEAPVPAQATTIPRLERRARA